MDAFMQEFDNVTSYRHWVDALSRMVLGSIGWGNMPKTIDLPSLEKNYFYKGQNLSFVVSEGPVTLPGMATGSINLYAIPIEREVVAPNGFTASLTPEDSCYTWNNSLRTPSIQNVCYYARKLAELDNIIAQNIDAQRTPWILSGDKNIVESLKLMFEKVQRGEHAVLTDDALELQNRVKVLSTGTPALYPTLYAMQRNYIAECLAGEGIFLNADQKAERQNVAQIYGAAGGVGSARADKLKARQPLADWLTENCREYLPDPDKPVTVFFVDDSVDMMRDHLATAQMPYDTEALPTSSAEEEAII